VAKFRNPVILNKSTIMRYNLKSLEDLDEQVKEVFGELDDENESDEERTVNTQDFGNQNESDIKPEEAEEMIDEEEDKRTGV